MTTFLEREKSPISYLKDFLCFWDKITRIYSNYVSDKGEGKEVRSYNFY